MNRLLKLALIGAIALGLSGTVASADVAKGQKLFSKKLKKACEMTGAKMAGQHTQDEWEKIHTDGNLKTELKTICPNLEDSALKDKFMEHYFDFFYEYASDSGNVPSC